jgi:hypothetical protein
LDFSDETSAKKEVSVPCRRPLNRIVHPYFIFGQPLIVLYPQFSP